LRLRDIPPGKIGVALAIPTGVLIVLIVIGFATGGLRLKVELPPSKPPMQVVER
jgi:hypothetical protein